MRTKCKLTFDILNFILEQFMILYKNKITCVTMSILLAISIGSLLIAVLSNHIGLGTGSDFLLYKFIGLSRRNLLNLSLTIVIFSLFYFFFYYHLWTQRILRKINLKFNFDNSFPFLEDRVNFIFKFLLIIFSLLYFLLFNTSNAFEWTTVSYIPLIYRLEDPTFLINDFFTNSNFNTPRIFPAMVFRLLSINILQVNRVLYLIKLLIMSITPIFVYMFLNLITDKISVYLDIIIEKKVQYFITFLSVVFMYINYEYTVFGWGSIIDFRVLSSMQIAFFFGLIGNVIHLKDFRFKYLFVILFLSISTFFHPIIGFFSLLILIFFELFFYGANIKLIRITFYSIGVLSVIGLMLYMFSSNGLSTIDYINIYIRYRHPHHYLVTYIFENNIFGYIYFNLIFVILVILNYKMSCLRNISLILYFYVIFYIFGISQYLFIEIFPVKFIATLGPSRFFVFREILLTPLILSTIFLYIDKYKTTNVELQQLVREISLFFQNLARSIFHVFKSKINLSIFTILSLLIFFFVTYDDPFNLSKNPSKSELIEWISNNTEEESVFFIDGDIDTTFIIRVLAQRAVFIDSAFSFDENFMEEFYARNIIDFNLNGAKIDNYICLIDGYKIDYFLLPNSDKGETDILRIFQNDSWIIYKFDDLAYSKSC